MPSRRCFRREIGPGEYILSLVEANGALPNLWHSGRASRGPAATNGAWLWAGEAKRVEMSAKSDPNCRGHRPISTPGRRSTPENRALPAPEMKRRSRSARKSQGRMGLRSGLHPLHPENLRGPLDADHERGVWASPIPGPACSGSRDSAISTPNRQFYARRNQTARAHPTRPAMSPQAQRQAARRTQAQPKGAEPRRIRLRLARGARRATELADLGPSDPLTGPAENWLNGGAKKQREPGINGRGQARNREKYGHRGSGEDLRGLQCAMVRQTAPS